MLLSMNPNFNEQNRSSLQTNDYDGNHYDSFQVSLLTNRPWSNNLIINIAFLSFIDIITKSKFFSMYLSVHFSCIHTHFGYLWFHILSCIVIHIIRILPKPNEKESSSYMIFRYFLWNFHNYLASLNRVNTKRNLINNTPNNNYVNGTIIQLNHQY